MSSVSEKLDNPRQTIFGLLAGFSFLVLSAYLVLWKQSNQDLRIAGTAAALFAIGVVFSPRKDVTLFAAFGFAGLRWAFGAIVTHEVRAIVATLVFLGVPTLMVIVDGWKRSRSVRS